LGSRELRAPVNVAKGYSDEQGNTILAECQMLSADYRAMSTPENCSDNTIGRTLKKTFSSRI
jgi:hypothetical protein